MDKQSKNAFLGAASLSRSRQVTARVHVDLLEWLKSQRQRYQSRINTIMRLKIQTSLLKGAPAYCLYLVNGTLHMHCVFHTITALVSSVSNDDPAAT